MLSTSVNKNSETVYNVEQISESYGGPFEIEVTLAAATAGPEGAIIQKASVTHYVEGDQNRLLFAEYLCKQ